MKGFRKLIIAGLTVALFVATTTCVVIYTAGCGSSGGVEQSITPTPTPIVGPTPTPIGPTPTPTYGPTPTPLQG